MVESQVEIGDKVYVGGIPQGDFSFINNKIGYIEDIIFTSRGRLSTYLVNVNINGEIHNINLCYVYKLNDLDTYDYDGILDDESPLNYYINRFNVVGEQVMFHDHVGVNYLYCMTRENNIKLLYLTSLN